SYAPPEEETATQCETQSIDQKSSKEQSSEICKLRLNEISSLFLNTHFLEPEVHRSPSSFTTTFHRWLHKR
ncbi:hypothetical protein PRIPAC_94620, partial [Pristionchus pacificus]